MRETFGDKEILCKTAEPWAMYWSEWTVGPDTDQAGQDDQRRTKWTERSEVDLINRSDQNVYIERTSLVNK